MTERAFQGRPFSSRAGMPWRAARAPMCSSTMCSGVWSMYTWPSQANFRPNVLSKFSRLSSCPGIHCTFPRRCRNTMYFLQRSDGTPISEGEKMQYSKTYKWPNMKMASAS